MKKLILITLLFANSKAFAVFFTEPYLGYKSESIKLTDLSNSRTEISTAQPNFGLKLGYRSNVGVDINISGEFSSGTAKVSTLTEQPKFTRALHSIQLGVNALGPVKMYLGTALTNEFKLEDSASLQGFKLAGPSYHAGVLFRLFTFMNLGLQYNLNQYNTIEGANYNSGNKTETYYNKIDNQDYAFYLSTTF